MAILITIIGFGIMIFLHELGHFITAKRFGVLVHEFAIGMGPKLFSFGKGETKYSLRLLPIGGYVKLEGENDTQENDNPRAFSNLPPLKRIIILVSGALMNVVLGFIIFLCINMSIGITPSVIDKIPDEFVSKQIHLKSGDEIIRLDNTRIHMHDDVSLFMGRYNGDKTIDITVKRDGNLVKISDFQPIKTDTGYMLGVQFVHENSSFLRSAQFAVYDTIYITKAVLFALLDLFTGKVGVNTLSGPVEIVSVVGSVTSQQSPYTYLSVLMLFAMITVNLGVFNLLPFPALDGGSIVFALYELITKKKIKSEVIGYATMVGFALMMLLALYVTAGDIIDLVK
ncbi:MAG: RIP metalloprotease RseP [Ruminococcaceae bacterium]|nr:RIP metalloprotease RseP [Oscillospiraceae bacterium]